MIKYNEWEFLIDFFKEYPKLTGSSEFGRGFWFNDKQKQEIEEKYNISIGGYCILGSYAGKGCFVVNDQLRKDNCNEVIFLYHDYLVIALDELPKYNAQDCYRWSNLDEKGYLFLKRFKGSKILMPQFWSTSIYKRKASDYFFQIKTSQDSNSRFIGSIVDKPSEGEVLFKAHTVFRIESYNDDTIFLTEMENHSDYDLFLCHEFWENHRWSKRSILYKRYLKSYWNLS